MNPTLSYLFLTFLKIGATSWGGFMALISMIQKKIVEKDGRLENATIVEGISLASVLPGPMAVNVVSFVGYQLGGWKGALVSVVAVILPSFLLMIVLSHLYFEYGHLPALNHFFAGMLPAVAAIIVSVGYNLGQKSITDLKQLLIALIAGIASFVSKSYLTTSMILVLSAGIGYFIYYQKGATSKKTISTSKKNRIPYTLFGVIGLLTILGIFPVNDATFKLQQTIYSTFSVLSITQFGGGYVIIPALEKVIVNGLGWLSHQAFTDAIAMGQVTPGPIFISATFIGYKLAGFWGALNATISIFAPAAILTVLCARFFNQINQSAWVVAIFKALRPAVIGMICAAGISILWSQDLSWFPILIFAITLFVTTYFKTDSVIVVPVAGIVGLLLL